MPSSLSERYFVLDKTSIRDVEIYSACLAVGNLWLTARAEGLGVGWVSILRNDALAGIFSIPDDVIPIAYLCIGYVREFPDRPILASADWAQRLPPKSLIHFDSWNDASERNSAPAQSLLKKIDDHSIWLAIFPEDSPDKPPSRG
jgi:5,6-dimethylbenzimidazole synthase